MRVTDQLVTLAETLRRIGVHSLKPGIWCLPGGCQARTGYVMGEATFWLEDSKGVVIPGTYYRGDDLLSWLVKGGDNDVLKNLAGDFAETLDVIGATP